MATIKTGAPYWYYGGCGGGSEVVGWEAGRTRVARHQFKTTSIGASSVSWTFEGISDSPVEGTASGGLKWYIGESSTSHADAGMNSEFTGNVKISNGIASGSADIILKPNTTYYLWVFPASETYGWWWWVGDYIPIEVVGSSSKLSLSSSSMNVGGEITANISRASSNFTHAVEFYINNSYYQKYEGVETSQKFLIPDSWYEYMPSTTSCTAYCRITTYNGATQIGDVITKSFTVKVPDSVVPTLGDITLTPTTINDNDILVKGKNELTISIVNCTAGTGSSIKSYTFSGPSISKTISSTSDNLSISIESVASAGTLSYKITVTDARGRSASKTVEIECYDYYFPSIKNFKAYRANSDGEADEKGSYLKCLYTADYASVNSTNSISLTIFYSDGIDALTSNEELIEIGTDTNKTYKVYARIEDVYGGYDTSNTATIFGNTRILNITKSGTGIAIGKMADKDNLFECRWPAQFDDGILVNSRTLLDWTHPVGSIYQSTDPTSPAELFGGTWEELSGRFLIGAGDGYSINTTGGSATVKLTQNQLPKITGGIIAGSGNEGTTAGGWGAFRSASGVFTSSGNRQYGSAKTENSTAWPSGAAQERVTMSFGNDEAHNNMPPYLVVYMWKRIK